MNRKTFADFEFLVENHSREIFNYLWRLLRDPQDAEDALQDTFLRAFRAYPKLQDTFHLRAWLYKIATNVAYTQTKRRGIRIAHTADFIDHPAIAQTDHQEQRDSLDVVMDAVMQLPYKQQTALLLRNYQGFEYEEIAKALDCSPESARANVYQALRKLRRKFAEEK